MSNRLYVGNLSFHTSEETLRSAFEAFGRVDRVDLPTDRETGRLRGFGFVTMGSADDAERAKNQMHGSTLDGRALRVDTAEERRGGSGGGGGGGGGGGRGGFSRGGGGGGGGRW
jgi:RNA recognition motif-containing protein